MVTTRKYSCGVDIGGSHITAALVDHTFYNVAEGSLRRKRIAANGSAAYIIPAWAGVINEVLSQAAGKPEHIYIAMPGPFDYNTGISFIKDQSKYDALYGLHIKQLLAEQLPVAADHIHFVNDAASFLQGEAASGAARGCERAMGFTLGTGLGSASYVNGRATDANLWCYPFKENIAEDYVSSGWFVRRYKQTSGKEIDGVRSLALMAANDLKTKSIFEEFGTNFGLFLGEVLPGTDTEMIILGGNIAQALPLFREALTHTLSLRDITIPVKQSVLGEQAAVIGAVNYYTHRPAQPINE